MHVEHCPAQRVDQKAVIADWLGQARKEGQEDTFAGKRRWPRVTWQVPVVLEINTGRGRTQTCYATSRDVSEGGLGLRTRQRVPVMALVRVTAGDDDRSVLGRVAHCTDTLGGFLVGIEFMAEPQALLAAPQRKSA
jgi:hypothetical protein